MSTERRVKCGDIVIYKPDGVQATVLNILERASKIEIRINNYQIIAHPLELTKHYKIPNKSELSIIDQICEGLGRYYKGLNQPYDAIFSGYCQDNGIDDDDAVLDELEQDPSDCLLVDFDDDFPFDQEPNDRTRFIYDLIEKIRVNPNISFVFGINFPTFDAKLFEIEENELDQIKQIYQTQCPFLWNSGIYLHIASFIPILAIGKKYNFDYLGHLVDDYTYHRIQNIDISYTVKQWVLPQNHKHFHNLRNVMVKDIAYGAMVSKVVQSFTSSICPKLELSASRLIDIDDSIQIAIKYIVDIIEFIGNLIHSKQATPPFQMDFCIVFSKTNSYQCPVKVNDGDDDDEEEEENDYKHVQDFADCIGNIQKKLIMNNLKYQYKQCDEPQEKGLFGDMFNDFKNQQKTDQETNEKQFCYPHNKRFITLIDRRQDKRKEDDEKKDDNLVDIWMYEPPEICRDIPNNAVPLVHIEASKVCLLPKLEDDNKKIGALYHCKGKLLTLSFIIKEADAIKCYLYWNGQMIRFMPEDVTSILTKIFNMKWNNGEQLKHSGYKEGRYGHKIEIMEESVNESYIENNKEEIKSLVDRMSKVLKDKYFKAFQQSYL